MKIRNAKILAAGAATVLAVPGLASVAWADGHHHHGEAKQIVEASVAQEATAHSGGNDATVTTDQTDGDTNSADTNSADVTSGGATADNSSEGKVVQVMDPPHRGEAVQVAKIEVAQTADGDSGDNTATVTITQPGTDNTADGNSASITTGDTAASNSSQLEIIQKNEG